jgi:nucleoside-diphosphate-sugar epimerase
MNCAIIGIGWLGKPLAEALIAAGWNVIGTNRSGKHIDVPGLIQHQFDPLSTTNTEFLGTQQLVILAFPPDRTNIDAYATACFKSCTHLSDECVVILISSTSVYPDKTIEWKENDCIPSDQSSHPILKCEAALREQLGSRLTIIRMAGLVGANRWPVRFMIRSGKIYNATDPVNLIHQVDAIGICLHVITHQIYGTTINACAPEHPTKAAYYSAEAKRLGAPIPLFQDISDPGKTINSDYIQSLGYTFQLQDPYDFN